MSAPARQATIAMENARLYEELRTYVRRMEKSQQALVQAEKLAVAGRLTASIAHEINNPLQGVSNCFHLATREDVPPEMRQKYLDMTQLELERLMTTVQRMLDFYRPSAEFVPVQVLDLLDHVLNLYDWNHPIGCCKFDPCIYNVCNTCLNRFNWTGV